MTDRRLRLACKRLRPHLFPQLLLVGLWLPGVTQGAFRSDTVLYTAVADYAFRGGNWWFLHVGETPYFNKPPLVFWLQGSLLRFLGTELWVVRLGSLIAAMLACFATMQAVKVLSGTRAAMSAGIVLAATWEFFRYTRAFSLDLWLTLWFMLSVWAAVVAYRRDRALPLVLAGVPLGLALLTKPLIGLLVPPVLALWLVWMRRPRQALWLCATAIVAIIIAAPWHLSMIVHFGDAFTSKYFGAETVSRFMGGQEVGGGSQPTAVWYYYFELLAERYWPWLLALVPAFILALRHAFRPVETGALPQRNDIDWETRRVSARRFCLLWIIIWLVALSLSEGKSGRYAIFLYPFLAWLVGDWLTHHEPVKLCRTRRLEAMWLGPLALVAGVIAALTPLQLHAPPSQTSLAFRDFLQEHQDEPLWAHQRMLSKSALVYLTTGDWPQLARLSIDDAGRDPPAGSLMLFAVDGSIQPRTDDEVVFKQGRFQVVRLTAPWQPTNEALEAP